MNCEEKALKARLEADHPGVKIERVKVVRAGGRVRVRVSLAGPAELAPPPGSRVRRGVLHVRVE